MVFNYLALLQLKTLEGIADNPVRFFKQKLDQISRREPKGVIAAGVGLRSINPNVHRARQSEMVSLPQLTRRHSVVLHIRKALPLGHWLPGYVP